MYVCMYVFHSIDATKESGRLGQLVNHSKTYPTAAVKLIEVDGVPRLYLFANQNIPKGAEILWGETENTTSRVSMANSVILFTI